MRWATIPFAILALSACVPSPQSFETEPVQLATPAGIVTCQLYFRDLVDWDRAINRPDSMSVEEADALCVELGKRRKESIEPTG